MSKTQLVSCVKDEAVFMLEWVAFHHLLGFDEILIFTNDCTDGTVELLQALQNHGYCRQVHNKVRVGAGAQPTAYSRHGARGFGQGFDHVMVLDADEFLNIHIGSGTLADLRAALPDNTHLLCLNWMIFGDGGLESWAPGCTIEQFQYAIKPQSHHNRTTKSLVLRPECFDRIGSHHPITYLQSEPLVALNAALQPIPVHVTQTRPLWKNLRILPPELLSHDIAQINHYSTRTRDSFALRGLRGRGVKDKRARHTLSYFNGRNQNPQRENSILRYLPALSALLTALRQIPESARIEAESIAEYRERLVKIEAKPTLI